MPYSEAQLKILEATLGRVINTAKRQFGYLQGAIDWEDIVQEVYLDILTREQWDPERPDCLGYLLQKVKWVGNDTISAEFKRAQGPVPLDETEACQDEKTIADEEKERERIRQRLLHEIEKRVPDFKKISDFQKQQIAKGEGPPVAKVIAAALGMSVDHVYYVRKCVTLEIQSAKEEVKRSLL